MSVLVVGAGAMGSLFAAELARAGHKVTVLDAAESVVSAISAHGVRLGRDGETHEVAVRAVSDPAEAGPADVAFVFVKAQHTAAVAGQAAEYVSGGTTVVSLQNGWGNADVLAGTVPVDQLVFGVTYHSCTVLEPGLVAHTSRGPTFVGPYAAGGDVSRAETVAGLLAGARFEVTATSGVHTEIWKKLVLNAAALPVAALTGLVTGALGHHAEAIGVVDTLTAEAVAVGRGRGLDVSLEERVSRIHTALAGGGNRGPDRRNVTSGGGAGRGNARCVTGRGLPLRGPRPPRRHRVLRCGHQLGRPGRAPGPGPGPRADGSDRRKLLRTGGIVRIVRYLSDGQAGLGIEREDGAVLPTGLTDLADALRSGQPVAAMQGAAPVSVTRLLAPVAHPGKILCCGVNYTSHKDENPSAVLPTEPYFFSKLPSAIIGPNDEIQKPSPDTQLDYEVELALVIGQRARHLTETDALSVVYGYTILNDVSARDVQFTDNQVTLGKGADTFCPLGPAVVTADELGDPQALTVSTLINGEQRQHQNTAEMLFPVARLLAYLTRTVTLEPGDVVSTGTPGGVGYFIPSGMLKPGDQVEMEINAIGKLANPVVAGWAI
jgi:2-dehydropantoate 2-reductase